MAERKFNFRRMKREFRRKKSKLPTVIGNMAKNHYQQSFRRQGFFDMVLSPWAARKTKEKGRSRAILVKSGFLRDSIKVIKATWNRIVIGTVGADYASYHNLGKDPQPKRQFMGRSNVLNNKIRRRIRREIKTIFR